MVSKSISSSKFNPSRSYIQEVKSLKDLTSPTSTKPSSTKNKKSQPAFSRDFYTLKPSTTSTNRDILNTNEDENEDFEDEDDVKDLLTNENFLTGLNSPRPMNSISSYRNHPSNKKDTELSITSLNKKKSAQPTLKIDLFDICNHDTDSNERSHEDDQYSRKENIGRYMNTEVPVNSKRGGGLYSRDDKFSQSMANFNVRKNTLTGLENSAGGKLQMSDFADETNPTVTSGDFSCYSLTQNPNLNLGASRRNPNQNDFGNLHKNHIQSVQLTGSDFHDVMGTSKRDDRLDTLESKLRMAEQKNEKADIEKQRLQVELDRLVLELKQTKMEWALSEESKEECELALKNEIKFLINKLLQVKNTGVVNSSSQSDLSQFTKSTLNKSTIDRHSTTSLNNTSGFLNFSSQYHPYNHSTSFNSSYHEQNNMTIIKNNLNDKKMNNDTTEKRLVKNSSRVGMEQNSTPLKERCLNYADVEVVNESPKRENEFSNSENSLLMNLLNTATHPKKLIKYFKR